MRARYAKQAHTASHGAGRRGMFPGVKRVVETDNMTFERVQTSVATLIREPLRLLEPGIWLALCAVFIAIMHVTGDNAFGHFSQRSGHDLLWPLIVGGVINAATFWANAFVLMPRFLEERAFGAYVLSLLALWAASALAQSVGQLVIIALREAAPKDVGFFALTLVNLATAPFVIAFSALYKVVRDWFGHIRERRGLNAHILHLSRELDASTAELRKQAAGHEPMIRLESGKQQFQIPLSEIDYVKAASNYVEVVTRGRTYLVYGQLKNIDPLLPKPRFLRVHRSYIVALDRIRVAAGLNLTLDGLELSVGPAYADAFEIAWRAWSEGGSRSR